MTAVFHFTYIACIQQNTTEHSKHSIPYKVISVIFRCTLWTKHLYETNVIICDINVASLGQKNYARTDLITCGINVVSSGKKLIRDKFESITQ